jgi:hypothetical protein
MCACVRAQVPTIVVSRSLTLHQSNCYLQQLLKSCELAQGCAAQKKHQSVHGRAHCCLCTLQYYYCTATVKCCESLAEFGAHCCCCTPLHLIHHHHQRDHDLSIDLHHTLRKLHLLSLLIGNQREWTSVARFSQRTKSVHVAPACLFSHAIAGGACCDCCGGCCCCCCGHACCRCCCCGCCQ